MQNFNKEDFEGYVSKKTLLEQDFQDYSNTDVLCAIRDCPTEKVAPIRFGKWNELTGNVDPRDNWIFCSECGFTTTDKHKSNYCQNCGADMRGE